MPLTIKTLGRIALHLNTDDPDTPAMVFAERHNASASWDCATDAGILTDRHGLDVPLTDAEIEWLQSFEDAVQRAFELARPEY